MNSYIFKTSCTMKPYNNKNWWIDSNIVTEKKVFAETIKDAIEIYRNMVENDHYILISNNAIKHREIMYRDTKDGEARQVGYIFTGKTNFQDDENHRWSTQDIDLWVEILLVTVPNFDM